MYFGAKRINIGLFPSALHSHPISSSERMVWHRYVVLAHMKELGLRLNAREVCFSSTENHLSGRSVGSAHDAGTYVPYSDCVNPHVSQESKRKLLGLMSAASKVIPFGLLYLRPLQWWLKTKRFSPRGNPLCMIKITRRCLCALDMWRKFLFFVSGPGTGNSLLPRNASGGCTSHRLGSGHE